MSRRDTAFLFDLDGTLVDSVYQHVLAWKEALDGEGIELSVWRIHRRIGMSGGLFTHMLARETGQAIDEARRQRLYDAHADAFNRQHAQGAVKPLPGARELLAHLSAQEIPGRSPPAASCAPRGTTSKPSTSIRRKCRW